MPRPSPRLIAALLLFLFFAGALVRVWSKAAATWDVAAAPLSARVLVDEGGKLDAKAALARRGDFRELAPGDENLFYSLDPHWFLYKLERGQLENGKSYVFFLAESSINQVDFALLSDGVVVDQGRAGTSVPPAERRMQTRRVSFDFPVDARLGRDVELLVRYESRNVIDGAARISTLRQFEHRAALENLLRGLYYGVFFALTIYNLFLYVSSVYREYLYYILFAVVTYGTQSGTDGFLDLFFYSATVQWSEHLIASSAAIGIFGMLFTRRFLDVPQFYPRLERAMLLACAGAGVAIVLHFAKVHRASIVTRDLALFAGMSLILTSSWRRWRGGYTPAGYFLLAWAFLIVFTSFFMLMLDGLLARTPFTEFALHIATTGELLLMSLGLGDRIRVLTAEKADEKRRADLKEARAAQLSTLVHVLCHDLVNPLTVMLGVAKLNLMKATMMPETPTDTKDWERVERACNNQTAIVNSVREMEAIIYGKRELPLTPLRLVEVYDNILFTFRARLEEKELELVTNFGQGGPMAGERVLVDPASFTHTVFSNLVSNAIKFSHPRGRIELLADGGGSQVRIVVRDYGIGMPESLKADIFEMTKKTTRAGTKGEKGTGFGMPLVKAYVERYGGRVTVESQPEGRPGQGTKFELLLQRAL